jgi:hypothetical protein
LDSLVPARVQPSWSEYKADQKYDSFGTFWAPLVDLKINNFVEKNDSAELIFMKIDGSNSILKNTI